MCIPPSRETQEINKKTLENGSTEPVIADKLTQESNLETCFTNLNGATEETSSNNADIVKESVIENHLDGTREQTTETNHNETECKKAKTVTFEKLEKAEKCVDAKMGSDAHLEKDVLTEDELQELHLKVDILHYLLPGWCHLTAEEEPRRLLLGSGALGVLDLYMWRQWERLVDRTASPGQTSSCLMVLCNIFLNLVIVDPGLVTENKEFSHILLLARGATRHKKKGLQDCLGSDLTDVVHQHARYVTRHARYVRRRLSRLQDCLGSNLTDVVHQHARYVRRMPKRLSGIRSHIRGSSACKSPTRLSEIRSHRCGSSACKVCKKGSDLTDVVHQHARYVKRVQYWISQRPKRLSGIRSHRRGSSACKVCMKGLQDCVGYDLTDMVHQHARYVRRHARYVRRRPTRLSGFRSHRRGSSACKVCKKGLQDCVGSDLTDVVHQHARYVRRVQYWISQRPKRLSGIRSHRQGFGTGYLRGPQDCLGSDLTDVVHQHARYVRRAYKIKWFISMQDLVHQQARRGSSACKVCKKGSELDISEAYKIVWDQISQTCFISMQEAYKIVWDQISQTWFISMQAFSECIPKYQELPGLILKAGWLPSLLKVIADVKANTVAEETKSCFQMLLTAVAKDNKAARAVIKEKGGDNLARFFKSKELTNSLNS
ncbi:hypothetical protein DPMN_170699 [Dreissena polymorpha]|uniref:Uncharacterized protein n=1 Tax=Dreissena polymorpha TaxID=45954 RepID=A0A9D4ID33_DREPO|nr:hypothetical protein DPMN_170699 [Dreissena polymorpha]